MSLHFCKRRRGTFCTFSSRRRRMNEHESNKDRRMNTWYREPLVHFLALGALLFGLYLLVNDDASTETDTQIVVTAADVEWLRQNWIRRWNRPPTLSELEGLVEAHIREEIYYREALALGLETDDTIIRRRLVQKMEFLSEDLGLLGEPPEEALRAFFEAHAEDYRLRPRLTFSHIYFNLDRGESARRDAEMTLSALQALASPPLSAPERGDDFMLPYEYTAQTPREIAQLFGQDFEQAILELESGAWSGPIASGYGLHLVYIATRTASDMPDLDQVREFVQRDFDNARREQMNESFFAMLRDRYDIEVDSTVLSAQNASNMPVEVALEEVGE